MSLCFPKRREQGSDQHPACPAGGRLLITCGVKEAKPGKITASQMAHKNIFA